MYSITFFLTVSRTRSFFSSIQEQRTTDNGVSMRILQVLRPTTAPVQGQADWFTFESGQEEPQG